MLMIKQPIKLSAEEIEQKGSMVKQSVANPEKSGFQKRKNPRFVQIWGFAVFLFRHMPGAFFLFLSGRGQADFRSIG